MIRVLLFLALLLVSCRPADRAVPSEEEMAERYRWWEPVTLSAAEWEALAQAIDSFEWQTDLASVRQQLPVPFEEKPDHRKEPPHEFIGTTVFIVVSKLEPGYLRHTHDSWVSLYFDANGRLTAVVSRVEGIESRYEEGSLLEALAEEPD